MKKSYIFAPAGALAIGGAVLYLSRRMKAKKAGAGNRDTAAAPKNLKAASYSFASGYKDAKTVTAEFEYDHEKFSYAVVSEDFLTDTGDSHAGILRGEDFAMQLEYAAYYGGEDFDAMSKHVSQRYKGFGEARFGNVDGIKYYDGKSLCLAFPAADSTADYLLICVLVPGDDADNEYLKLWESKDLQAILRSLRITAK